MFRLNVSDMVQKRLDRVRLRKGLWVCKTWFSLEGVGLLMKGSWVWVECVRHGLV
jgi:hypothetical protein